MRGLWVALGMKRESGTISYPEGCGKAEGGGGVPLRPFNEVIFSGGVGTSSTLKRPGVVERRNANIPESSLRLVLRGFSRVYLTNQA